LKQNVLFGFETDSTEIDLRRWQYETKRLKKKKKNIEAVLDRLSFLPLKSKQM
jgi:hypothetical protein